MRSRVTQLIQDFNALNEIEQKVFLDQVDPQPEPEEQPKKSNKKAASATRKGRCAACDYGKAASIHHDNKLVGYHVYQSTSRSAQSISAAIAKTPKGESYADGLCTAQVPGLDVLCGEREDNLIHDRNAGYAAYHPFESSAKPAGKKSSRKGAGTNSTPSSETEKENVSAVGASAGD